MASIARYNPSFRGVGEMLRSEGIRRAMRGRAAVVNVVFRSTAAIGNPADGDPHPGAWRASTRVETYVRKDFKGRGRRVVAAVISDDPQGLVKEQGHVQRPGGGREGPGRFVDGTHDLLRALSAARL